MIASRIEKSRFSPHSVPETQLTLEYFFFCLIEKVFSNFFGGYPFSQIAQYLAGEECGNDDKF